MGATKRWLEEEQARGYKSGNTSLICSKHIEDYALKNFIETKGKVGKCEYCEVQEESKVVTFDQLMEVIVQGIYNHYSHPDDEGVPYIDEFGGYWEKTYDTDDLIRWVIGLDGDDGVIEEVIDAIGREEVWCVHSPGYPRESELLSFDWNLFCKMLKHKVRYVFFRYPKKMVTAYRSNVNPTNVLDKIGKAVVGLKLFYNTETGLFNNLSIYRARQHKRNVHVKSCKDIGPLSLTKANNPNRFSPPGIPMFYGSKNKNTAILEVIDRQEKNQIVTTARFRNVRPLNLVDLTQIPHVSIFDLKRAEFYEAAVFLKEFSKNISKKVKKGDTQHFEYVPTQVVTEYFRHVLPYEAGIKVDGLVYKSSVADDNCYVIFCDSRHCQNDGQQSRQTVLVLEQDSIEKLKVKDFRRRKETKLK